MFIIASCEWHPSKPTNRQTKKKQTNFQKKVHLYVEVIELQFCFQLLALLSNFAQLYFNFNISVLPQQGGPDSATKCRLLK